MVCQLSAQKSNANLIGEIVQQVVSTSCKFATAFDAFLRGAPDSNMTMKAAAFTALVDLAVLLVGQSQFI